MKNAENSSETRNGCLSCLIRLGNHFSPNWKQVFQKLDFFRKTSHSAENPKESDVPAKHVVSGKSLGASISNWKKVAKCRKNNRL